MSEAVTRACDIALASRAPRPWRVTVAVSAGLTGLLLVALVVLFAAGVGIWGLNVPVSWGFAIVNFVWWIGIAHAGTLISAILLLLRQGWRTEVNRFAETMTVFAVVCAALFPLIHLGRPWLFYWLFPYSSPTGAWPQFRSPLVWDVFAIGTYGVVSVLFWYAGLVPDLAVMRDRASGLARKVYGVMAMGWRGEAGHWQRYETGYRLLAGLATALVVSVHSIVSFDFAVSNLPGWHSTIFPPYFVAGAMFSGFAMLLVLLIPVRAVYQLEGVVTSRHLDTMAKVMLATGLVVAYGYCAEVFAALYSGGVYERALLRNRFAGPDAAAFWTMLLANVALPQLLWSRKVRSRPWWVFGVAVAVVGGMWLERYVIVVTSLRRDFLPSSWGLFAGTFWDWATLAGSAGLFLLCMALFLRRMPAVSMVESGLDRGAAGEARDLAAVDSDGRSVLAEFGSVGEQRAAVEALQRAGVASFEVYSPEPIRGVVDAKNGIAWWALAGGVVGAAAGFALQYWVSVVEVGSNVGGRPLNSWPAFLPVTFECAILCASLATFLGMFAGSGLPRLHHPVFNAPNFSMGGGGRFYVAVRGGDSATVAHLFEESGAKEVTSFAP